MDSKQVITKQQLKQSSSSDITAEQYDYTQQKSSISLPLSDTSLTGLAGKLFSILTEIKKTNKTYNPNDLRPYLLKQLDQFALEAKQQGHNEETILISQYVIAKSLDNVIMETSWGKKANWQAQDLISSLPHAQSLKNNFNLALKKMCEMPDLFIDILELIYLCLNLTESSQWIDSEYFSVRTVNQELFHLIQQQRGEFEKRLAKKTLRQKKQLTKRFKFRKFTLLTSAIITLVIVSALYISFSYLLSQSSLTIQQQLQTLNSDQGSS